MSQSETRPVRVWPGIVIVALQWIVTLGSGWLAPGTVIQFFGMTIGPLGGVAALFIWWLFASRAPWSDRGIGVVAIVAGFFGTIALADDTMPMAIFLFGTLTVCLTFVLAVALTRDAPSRTRRIGMLAAVVVGFGIFLGMRSEGVRGDMGMDLRARWSATPEDRLLAQDPEFGKADAGVVGDDEVAVTGWVDPQWPGFRGEGRDSVVRGARIATDWSASPPQELWRRPVGPGWSSFAVAGNRLYTQEQRGDDEIIACYDATSGEPIWTHRDPVRFSEPMAGAGPRATPTLHQGRLYAMGATGVVNALDATSGRAIWRRDAAADTGAEVPEWGFASSPLIVDDLAIVHTGGADGKSVVAYDLASGEPRWFAPAGTKSYSSAHLATVDGTRQILLLTGDGINSLSPEDGTPLWEHTWVMEGGARIVQPGITADGDVLVGTGFGMGLRRLDVQGGEGAIWSADEQWTSTGLKPYFNDFVIHDGLAYGFDGRILACVDLADGERRWKGGRYGHGQVMLLEDQGLLLVLSEKGELALVRASGDGFEELSRMPAIAGKTWNHPVLVDGVVYVRNGEEMAAFRLDPA